jgi:hypothetical protein
MTGDQAHNYHFRAVTCVFYMLIETSMKYTFKNVGHFRPKAAEQFFAF